MLQRWLERKWSCYRGGQFNGGSMVITEVAILMEGDPMAMLQVTLLEGDTVIRRWFHGGRMVILQRCSL